MDVTEGTRVFNSAPAQQDAPVPAEDAVWTIVLAAYRGDAHRAAAEGALPALQAVQGLERAFVTSRGQASFIGLGRFGEPGEVRAQAELDRVRGLVVGGERPFADAFFAPPVTRSLVGSRPEYNLQRARERLGKGAWVTLQVGVYDRIDATTPSAQDLATIRAAAEEAAVQLRREGEQAYYFHGPRRSMVTIGLFPERDLLDARAKKRLPAAAEALRKRHPHNLLNGAGYKASASGRVMESAFVRVP